jgi:hypothetical protein
VLDHGLVCVQVQRDDERAEPSGAGSGSSPNARGQAQGGVLALWLSRRQLRGDLPQHLRVRVERVAGLAPVLVGTARHRSEDAIDPR